MESVAISPLFVMMMWLPLCLTFIHPSRSKPVELFGR
jgi:hypothetical protein